MDWPLLKLSSLCSIKNVKWPNNNAISSIFLFKYSTCCSRVMTDELASAKAFYTMQYQECQVA